MFGQNDPNLAALFGKEEFTVDLSLPIFADPNLRMTPHGPAPLAQFLIDQGALSWNITIEGRNSGEMQNFSLKPLPIDMADGMPTYIPANHSALDAVRNLGTPYFRSDLVWMLEAALWNIGVKAWPNIAALDYKPKSIENDITTPYPIKNLNITLEVSNGKDSDSISFPFIVIEQPVDNYPPVLDLDFIKLERHRNNEAVEYVIKCIDPDCFIFSMSGYLATMHTPGFPVSEDFRNDMDAIQWSVESTIFPPSDDWIKPLPGPLIYISKYGEINWFPEFGYNLADTYHFIVECHDNYGGSASSEILILCNDVCCYHPPIVLTDYPNQVQIGSNQEYILYFEVVDPDGDTVYPVCTIGAIEDLPDGSFIWKYKSSASSASYPVEIIIYDPQGSYAVIHFSLNVTP